MTMSNAAQTWFPIAPTRTNHALPTAVFVIAGVLGGTGGCITADRLTLRSGTGAPAPGIETPAATATAEQGPAVQLQAIRSALRLSVSELAQLFAVSRPTIYNWQRGEAMKPSHAARVREITDALEPHLAVLDAQVGRVAQRAIEGRTSLLQALTQGQNARESIDRLADILRRETTQRERLARRLQARIANRGAADLDTLG
jgi:transcriptional regulator with XRE-family HTH domain